MDKEKELKVKKILLLHKQKGIITKKQYKKEMEFIKMLKQSKDDKQKHNTQRHSNTYIS